MKKSLKTIQKEESKQRILNVATRLFKKQGYNATGIDQFMHEAGLTAGAFYAHFKSKDDLFEQCLQHALIDSRQLLTKDTENLSGPEKTKAVLKRYCSEAHRDFADRGCVLPSLASEIYRGPSQVNQIVAGYIEKWAELISKNLDENLSDFEKKEIALQMISRSVGAILLSRIVKETPLSQQILFAAQKI
jgi:AcrR family transcriptional regulator